MHLEHIKKIDTLVAEQIEKEFERQQNTIELIASENITSEAVMEACGSVLTNKYAEGKPHKRFYNGCEHVDVIEEIAQKRACELFHMDHANVQPHSGAQANMAVFMAVLKPGDKVLGMDLSNGGHLSHGSPVNFSGMYFDVKSYGVDENGNISVAISGTNDPDGKIAKENAERKAKENREKEEKVKEKRAAKKAEEEKAAKQRAEKSAERKETGDYTLSITGNDVKSMTQSLVAESVSISAPDRSSFDIKA